MPDKVRAIPPDPWKGRAERAEALYLGEYAMGGRTVTAVGESVMPMARELAETAPDWTAALASFRWLRDLEAEGTPLARSNAQALAVDWIAAHGRNLRRLHWAPGIAAIRLGHWLTCWNMLSDDANHAVHDALRLSISRHVRFLKLAQRGVRDPVDRTDVALSLAFAQAATGNDERIAWDGVVAPDLAERLRHRPDHAVRILCRLVQARQAAGKRWPAEAAQAASALARDLASWRLRAGLATTRTGLPVPVEAVETVLAAFAADDPAPAEPGALRTALGDVTLVLDVSPDVALEACGAFEMGDRSGRLVVSCGASEGGPPELVEALRHRDARSMFGADGGSLAPQTSPRSMRGAQGVREVGVETGLRGAPGATHRRTLRLERVEDRSALNGSDAFAGVPEGTLLRARFHLAPDVAVQEEAPGRIRLARAGTAWTFFCVDAPVSLEETAIFGDAMQPSMQIVVEGKASGSGEWRWAFMRDPATS